MSQLRRNLLVFGLLVAVLAAPAILVHPALSDPVQPASFTTTATVVSPPQTNILNPGPLNGLVDGTSVTVNMMAAAGSASAGKFFGAEARLCKGGINIVLQSQYNPGQGGNCIPMPFDGQSDADVIVTADASNSTATATFRVGTGSETFQANSTSTVTCDSADPCSLWVKEQFSAGLVNGGFEFVHFDLQFASTGTTTTTVPPTGTTTTVPATTTTTTVPATTTTTTVPATTTTTTATTTVPATTTTLPGQGRGRLCSVLRLLERFLPFIRPLIDRLLQLLGCPVVLTSR